MVIFLTKPGKSIPSDIDITFAPFSIAPPLAAAAMGGRALVRDLRPDRGEGWADKLRRTLRAFRDATTRASDHNRALDERANGETW